MRAAVAAVLLVCASARADVSVDAVRRPPAPHTPFGPACDRALAAAQASLDGRANDVHFETRERHVVGDYQWSDMCGVWGDYSIDFATDLRPAHGWRWSTRYLPGRTAAHRTGVMRAHGVRATFFLEGDDPSDLGDWFVEAFRPAVEVCLATRPAPR